MGRSKLLDSGMRNPSARRDEWEVGDGCGNLHFYPLLSMYPPPERGTRINLVHGKDLQGPLAIQSAKIDTLILNG